MIGIIDIIIIIIALIAPLQQKLRLLLAMVITIQLWSWRIILGFQWIFLWILQMKERC